MPSDFLTPFLELDEEFCKNFRGLDMAESLSVSTQGQRVVGFQRRHSLCPVTLPNSKFNNGSVEPVAEPTCWPLSTGSQQWNRELQQQLPRSSLNHIPFRVDRSVSMIESNISSMGTGEQHLSTPPPMMPPPGLSISTSSLSSKCLVPTPPLSTRYKTELCRTYEESGTCKYGAKCQFAHGMDEVRGLSRHPKYKTEPCRTFHTIGFCPYGARCHFVHNNEEQNTAPPQRPGPRERPQLLRQSISFAGFSSSSSSSPPSLPQFLAGFQPLQDPPLFSRACSVSPPPSTGSPELLSPLLPEPEAFKQGYPFSSDLAGDHLGTPRFYAVTDSDPSPSKCQSVCGPKVPVAQKCHHHHHHHQNQNQYQQNHRQAFSFMGLPALQRCSSADSLSDLEGYSSSSSLSGSESPSFEGRRLPIFSRLSISDD